jgi:hypothetical protein
LLDEIIEIEESELPEDLTDGKIIRLGEELGREFDAYSKPRLMLENEIWPACDRAFMCIRDDMPFIPTMKFIDNGMLGESDVRDAIKMARNQIISGTVPSDGSWLEPASLTDDDDEETLRKVKDLLISKFEDAGIRDVSQVFTDQLLSRGISAMGLRWTTRKKVRKIPRAMLRSLKDISEAGGITDDEGNLLHKSRKPVKYWDTFYDGPEIYPIDMYRLWLDPVAGLGKDSEPSYIYLTFKTMSDLKNAVDEDGKNLYDHKVLENVTEWKYSDYYSTSPWAASSTKLMGVDPTLDELGKFVPVYLFYRQVRVTEDEDTYIDKIFYVARSGNKRDWSIIRIDDNPSDFGDKPFFVANCDSWMNVPYGTGLAEKSLSALKAKNVVAAIALNAMVLQEFPPMFFVGNVLKDDRKPKMQPGGFQEIIARPGVGMDWIQPYPLNPNNVAMSMQDQKYLSEKILSQTGVQTAGLTTDPSKSLSKSKTATEVKQTTTEGVMAQQVIVDKLNNGVYEPMAQALYNALRQHAMGSSTKFTNVDSAGKPVTSSISAEQLDKDRNIKIVGRRGLANKAQKLDNLGNILKILSNPQAGQVINNLPLMLQDVLFELIAGLGLAIKPEYRATPEEIFAKEPKVQEAALQLALQDPNKRQEIAEMLLNSPDGQRFLQQLEQHFTSQAPAEPGMSPTPIGPPPMPQIQGAA